MENASMPVQDIFRIKGNSTNKKQVYVCLRKKEVPVLDKFVLITGVYPHWGEKVRGACQVFP